MIDHRRFASNFANVFLVQAALAGPVLVEQYMTMHKLKYPAGDGAVCLLGNSWLVHGLTVGQWDDL